MFKEIEAKFQIKNITNVKKKLVELGLSYKGIVRTKDVYFCVPEKKPHTKYLRVRIEKSGGELAYHEVIDNEQTNEWEILVSDYKTAIEIIEKLGFKHDVDIVKERMKFQNRDVYIVFDKVDKLGYFIEIEAPSNKILHQYTKSLDIDKKDRVTGLGYPDLLRNRLNAKSTK